MEIHLKMKAGRSGLFLLPSEQAPVILHSSTFLPVSQAVACRSVAYKGIPVCRQVKKILIKT